MILVFTDIILLLFEEVYKYTGPFKEIGLILT
jgi:hypothetical protein